MNVAPLPRSCVLQHALRAARAETFQHSRFAFGRGRIRPFHSSSSIRAKDPYHALGISKGATAPEIKKAYYALAKKFHPDTNKEPSAKERFADAQSAYEVLNDPKKKAAYDKYGAAAFDPNFDPNAGSSGFGQGFGGFGGSGQGGFGADFNFEDLFSAFGGRRKRANPFQDEVLVGESIEVQTTISFMDAAKGTTKQVFTTPLVQCNTCHGNGLKKGYKKDTCRVCGGTGTQVHVAQAGFQMASTCTACGGQGVSTPRGAECGTCHGNGVVREKQTVSIDIPGGVEDGMRMRVRGEGDMPPTGQAPSSQVKSQKGDLYVLIRVASDPKFSRSGSDILYTAAIPVTTAMLGGEIKVPTLDGEVRVKVNTGTATGDRIILSNMGMAKLTGRRASKGDLRVEFKVQMPKYLSANQRTLVEMLATDIGDKTAKRMETTEAGEDQKQGFLKRAWNNMTGQHDVKDEPKKATGSGS